MLQNKEQRGRLIAGVVIILLGVMALVNNLVAGNITAWLWIVALAASAVIFGWAYTFEREAWAAVVAYVFAAIAVVVLLTTQVKLADDWIPVVVLAAIGVPFVVAWLMDRKQWYFLIPAYAMFAIIPILFISETVAEDQLIPAYVMLVIGIPFIVVFAASRSGWLHIPWGGWLLIPGGIMVLLGLAFLGVGIGLTEQVLTIVVPIIVIAAGVILLFSRSGQPRKQH